MIKVSIADGMVNIESEDLFYGNIKNMYASGRNGSGCQINTLDQAMNDKIRLICDQIASLSYELEAALKQVEPDVSVAKNPLSGPTM